ncbi:MAG: hypothetical protein GY811_14080 [Myxococcales bacterium]|nr:hypothetical protein [Myxococcales bacterium]
MSATRQTSLLRELSTISSCIEAARLVSDTIAHADLPARDQREAPAIITAVLRLVVARLDLLGATVDGSLDVIHLWADWNQAYPHSDDLEDRDIVLSEDEDHRAEVLEQELARLERRQEKKNR